MNTSELRRAFTDFFAARDHTVVPSGSLIPTHPTAPMFTNSGMMPFVPYFLGEEPVPFKPPRAADVQKCVRAGGKHNDLDAIGRTARHLSFFEMLGNWSFGDYFKREAIQWAWELLTGPLGLDGDRMWVTVHVSDDDAEQLWIEEVGFPASRLQRLDKDNFWEMGDVGPCGPCSEIFWDYGAHLGPGTGPADPAAEDRFVEIWNLVFMQYFRRPDGGLDPLPASNVDTGAGLERMLTAINGVETLWETDVLGGLIDAAGGLIGHQLGTDERADIRLKVVADHTRTATFLVSDGVVPSNEDRGYVLRRIIRRAVLQAHLLGARGLVMPTLVGDCIDRMADGYPELVANRDAITATIEREEGAFHRTLTRGAVLLDNRLGEVAPGQSLAGDVAFDLYETYGFPLEVTEEVAAEAGVTVDQSGYATALAKAQQISKAGAKQVDAYANLTNFQQVAEAFGTTDFVGREHFEDVEATVQAVVPGDGDPDATNTVSIFLDRTPFYAESGGQVGDTGTITTATGRAEVVDTTYGLPGLVRHHARVVEGTVEPGQAAVASIDVARRDAIRRNHTGTHILHWALRQVLGEGVKQQGSMVGPDRLRFDFGPADALTPEQIRRIEDLANAEILANPPARHYETTKDEAMRLGAIAFFGDKYGDIVRVLEAGPHSVELCGGTHVRALGDIGPLKVVKEESIGSNLRRVEAVTGTGPVERLRDAEATLAAAADALNVSVSEVVEGARKRADELKALRKELDDAKRRLATGGAADLAAEAIDGVVIARVDGLPREGLRDLAVAIRDRPGIRAAVLGGAPEGGGAALVAAVAPDADLHAGDLIGEASKAIKGGGGKGADLAVAGGKDAEGIDDALARVRALL